MNKKRANEVYRFLATASMKRMSDEEKIMFIRLLRTLKPVAQELQDAVNDAVEKARENGVQDIEKFVTEAVEDIARQNCGIITSVMARDTFDRLVFSNDWNFGQIEELEDVLVKKE